MLYTHCLHSNVAESALIHFFYKVFTQKIIVFFVVANCWKTLFIIYKEALDVFFQKEYIHWQERALQAGLLPCIEHALANIFNKGEPLIPKSAKYICI
jgi:hypothetical protein